MFSLRWLVLLCAMRFLLVVAEPLATITPCPNAPIGIESPSPITVTAQYQEVSTCRAISACFRGSCRESLLYSTWRYVSTTIPCEWNGTAVKSTLVTNTAQPITISTFVTTETVDAASPTVFNGTHWDNVTATQPAPSQTYATIARNYVVPYNNIGPLAIPGYSGSDLCLECGVRGDGSREQVVTVTECRSQGDGPSCVQYVQYWVSSPAAASTHISTLTVSTSTIASTTGIWTFTFSRVAPSSTFTDSSTTWTAGPHPYAISFSTPCTQADQTINIITTLIKTIIYTIPPSVRPASTSTSCSVPIGPAGFPSFQPSSTTSLTSAAATTTPVIGDSPNGSFAPLPLSASAAEDPGVDLNAWISSSGVASSAHHTTLWEDWSPYTSEVVTSIDPTTTWGAWSITFSSSTKSTSSTAVSSWADWPPQSPPPNSVPSLTTPTPTPSTTLRTSSSVSGAASTTGPGNASLFYIELQRVGLRYRKRAPSYIRFDGEDAYLTEQKAEAALFHLLGDLLFHGSLYVGSALREGSAVFEQQEDFHGSFQGWSRNGDALSYAPARLGFCVTDALNVFILLTKPPTFQCASYVLRAENQDGAHPTPTASTTTSTTQPFSTTHSTTMNTPNPSADMDDEPFLPPASPLANDLDTGF